MQRYRSSLIVGFVVALIIQLRVAKLDKGFLDGLAANMRKSQKLKVDIPDTLAALGSCGIEKAHTVLSFLDAGSGGALFNVAENGPEDPRTHLPSLGNPYTAKIVLEDDNRFSICKREKLVDQLNEFVDVEDLNTEGKVVKFKERKVSYLNIITKYDQIVGTNNQRSVFACVLILEETKSDSTDVLFSKTSEGIKPNNSKKLLRFFGKVALSLAELHFKAHTLHGNVNPGCIMKKSIKGDTDIDPILTDFSRALINDSGKDLPDAQLRYEADYRPPEMTEKTKEGI